MGQVIEIAGWAEKKVQAVADTPPLECPQCGTNCAAINVEADGTTAYRCKGNGHRAIAWRIDADGSMLRGLVGKRYY
ncbi:hypothetical protein [Azonexus hydrophilus]|uniref:Uncharacterized protein n=1 Tax=Azonexus hydrophilus TaxID=418702 RepID=A0ABZ2XKW8_9RHOO